MSAAIATKTDSGETRTSEADAILGPRLSFSLTIRPRECQEAGVAQLVRHGTLRPAVLRNSDAEDGAIVCAGLSDSLYTALSSSKEPCLTCLHADRPQFSVQHVDPVSLFPSLASAPVVSGARRSLGS
jgi:CTP:molybdopterin cytidylyltransferase MocA